MISFSLGAFAMDLRLPWSEDPAVVPLLLWAQLASVHAVGIGDHAPDQPVPGLDGKRTTLAKQGTTVVSFFATWCEPCHAAIADLLAIQKPRSRFTLVLIAVGDAPDHVRRFVKSQGIPDDVVVGLDPTAAIARAWGQDRFPTTFLVDERWTLRHINRGYGRGFRLRIDRWLRAMQAAQ